MKKTISLAELGDVQEVKCSDFRLRLSLGKSFFGGRVGSL
jgi:hypothetical protein